MPKTAARTAAPEKQKTEAAPALPMRYDVRINSLQMNGNTKGTATVNLNGQFAFRNISIMQGKESLFASPPGYKVSENNYKSHFFPCTKESHAEFESAVLGAYEQALTQSQESGQQMGAPDPFAGQAPNSAPEMRM